MITMLVYGRRRPSSQPVEEIPMTSTRCPLPLMEGTDDLARFAKRRKSMCKPSGRRKNSLGFCLVVALCVSIVPGVVFAVQGNGNGNAGKVEDFMGLWEGVDPLDGSTVRLSLTDVNDDGILELTQAENFYSVCHSMGPEFSLGRGVEVGIATVGSRKDVLEVDIRLICIEDNNVPHERSPVSIEYQLRSHGRNLVIPAFPNSLPILLHRVAQ